MSQLTPCPECQRHVRKTEARCPFCDSALSLAHVPAPVLPRKRLGRAATFAFGATVAGATALAACDDTVTVAPPYGGPAIPPGGSSSAGSAGAPSAGSANGGSSNGGTDMNYGGSIAIYGAPAAGTGGTGAGGDDAGGAGGTSAGGEGGEGGEVRAIYGGPPAGAGGV